MDKIQVYQNPPEDFTPQVEIAAVYVEYKGRILFLKLAERKKEAGCYGVPAGKLEKGETPRQGAVRELYEETGIQVREEDLKHLGALYMRKPEVDYVYHLFSASFDNLPQPVLSDEHADFIFATVDEALALPLMLGAKEALLHYVE